ncbi:MULTISPECIES: YbaB/EbfC family nucleoid-associated protein [Atopobium]|nr:MULTISPECIES: YbaB/EbfC family nucleoid-associated protein [Atopobium]MBS4873162.1 YbaB/EbfC family nucleoid-associated protein [Atopobium minutum]MDU4970272.1 YbaB/EbfC family nucleoid-associated protein [Atopobium minutum]MDU5130388.1 YbaB/EbfC family nucleoid-associated protein [Atopobium minutum]MDU5357515.1 YbaB/EbfC family nucleoid-associated protein [Atopobium minutum]MDU5892482.1 YbaB/EbfC family nucleoid-associated protein [Atopobium minutum]
MNMAQMMKQARKMQEQLAQAEEALKDAEVSSSAGGGMVKVSATGNMRITSIQIDPQAVDPDDVELLQDMVMAAVNDALNSAQELASQQMGAITGGLNIPGLM